MHPANSCQPTHVTPLISIYGGTISTEDRQILSIMRLFEHERHLSALAVIKSWNGTSVPLSGSRAIDALTSLDPVTVMRTCVTRGAFSISSEATITRWNSEEAVYDPHFVVSLLSAVIQGGIAGIEWVKLFQTNAPCVAIRALSAEDESIRASASVCLSGLWYSLQVRSQLSCWNRYSPTCNSPRNFTRRTKPSMSLTSCGISYPHPRLLRPRELQHTRHYLLCTLYVLYTNLLTSYIHRLCISSSNDRCWMIPIFLYCSLCYIVAMMTWKRSEAGNWNGAGSSASLGMAWYRRRIGRFSRAVIHGTF